MTVWADEFMRPDDSFLSFQTVAPHVARYYFASLLAWKKNVLDVACGSGYGTHLLATIGGAKSVTGADLNREAITCAKKHFGHDAISFLRVDAQKLPFGSGAFDMVVSFETLEHLSDPEAFVAEARRVLAPDGIFICSTPNADDPLGSGLHSQWHRHEFQAVEFQELLLQYFSRVELFGQEFVELLPRNVSRFASLSRVLGRGLRRIPWTRFLVAAITQFVLKEFRPVDLTRVSQLIAGVGPWLPWYVGARGSPPPCRTLCALCGVRTLKLG